MLVIINIFIYDTATVMFDIEKKIFCKYKSHLCTTSILDTPKKKCVQLHYI